MGAPSLSPHPLPTACSAFRCRSMEAWTQSAKVWKPSNCKGFHTFLTELVAYVLAHGLLPKSVDNSGNRTNQTVNSPRAPGLNTWRRGDKLSLKYPGRNSSQTLLPTITAGGRGGASTNSQRRGARAIAHQSDFVAWLLLTLDNGGARIVKLSVAGAHRRCRTSFVTLWRSGWRWGYS